MLPPAAGASKWLSGKESACNVEDTGDASLNPGSAKFPPPTHSSILDWRIPWTEEPGGLQSMRSKRIKHDSAHTCRSFQKDEERK